MGKTMKPKQTPKVWCGKCCKWTLMRLSNTSDLQCTVCGAGRGMPEDKPKPTKKELRLYLWMQDITSLLCYQPEVPHAHKESLVKALNDYLSCPPDKPKRRKK